MEVIQAIICRGIQHGLTPTIIEAMFIFVTERSVLALFHIDFVGYARVSDHFTVSRINGNVTPVRIEKCLVVSDWSIAAVGVSKT